jgi:hypothetical protein
MIMSAVNILGVDPGIRGGLAIIAVDANGAAPQLVDESTFRSPAWAPKSASTCSPSAIGSRNTLRSMH